jgi:hypothetical protein
LSIINFFKDVFAMFYAHLTLGALLLTSLSD